MPDWERKYMGRWKMPNDDYILRSDALRCKCTFEQSNGVEIEPIDAVPFSYLQNIPAADVEPRQRWISVTERPPEEPGEYIVAYHPCHWDVVGPSVKVGIDSFRGKTTWAKNKYQRVIAWQEKPEPPKEDSDAKGH